MADQSFLAAVGLIFVIFSFVFAIPVVFVSLENPEFNTITQKENETKTVNAFIDTNAQEIQIAGTPPENDFITVKLIKTDTGETITIKNITINETKSGTLDSQTINVTNEDIINESNTQIAIVTYEYPVLFGWPDGAKTVVNNLGLILILLGITFVVGTILLIGEVMSNGN